MGLAPTLPPRPQREPTQSVGRNGRRTRPFPSPLMQLQRSSGRCSVPLTKTHPDDPDRLCRHLAGARTNHPGYGACWLHGGSLPTNELAAAKQEALDRARSLAAEREMDPLEAMLWCVRLSAGAVDFYRSMIDEIPLLEDFEQSHEGNEEWFSSVQDRLTLIIDGLHKAYGEERDRLAKTAEMCVRAGLQERQVSLAERQGDLLAQILIAVLDDLDLPLDVRRQARQLAAQKLLAIPAVAREAALAE